MAADMGCHFVYTASPWRTRGTKSYERGFKPRHVKAVRVTDSSVSLALDDPAEESTVKRVDLYGMEPAVAQAIARLLLTVSEGGVKEAEARFE
ncbi:MAG: hypothetical protein Q8P22_12165 [Chloroflexota bacterium]|nr:hypothetical protein [Chloroflexota bacterium]